MLEYAISLTSAAVKNDVLKAIDDKYPGSYEDDEYPISNKQPTIWVTTPLSYEDIESIPGVKSANPVYKGEGKPCRCGSGLPNYSLEDANGIFCARICDNCEAETKAKYRPEIFTDPNYTVDEEVDPEECIAYHDEDY